MPGALSRVLSHTLQDDATTGDGVAVSVPTAGNENVREHMFYITGSTGVTAGAVTLETAPTVDYAGTWGTITTAVTVPAEETTPVSVRGLYLAVRARISTDVVGGTVSVVYAGG